MKTKTLIGLVLVAFIVGSSFLWLDQQKEDTASTIVPVTLPATLSLSAQTGKSSFDANCASCHGANAAGQDGTAPPLIHKIYEPSHHGDESFQRAVASGVRAHHWPFGNMPPIEELDRKEISKIITYIRELQRANNIF